MLCDRSCVVPGLLTKVLSFFIEVTERLQLLDLRAKVIDGFVRYYLLVASLRCVTRSQTRHVATQHSTPSTVVDKLLLVYSNSASRTYKTNASIA